MYNTLLNQPQQAAPLTHRAGSRTIVTRSLDTPEMQHPHFPTNTCNQNHETEQPPDRAREHLHHERVYNTPRELDLLPP